MLYLVTDVVVSLRPRVQHPHLDQVEDEAHHCDNEHDVALDENWLLVAIDSFDYHPAQHDPDGGDL